MRKIDNDIITVFWNANKIYFEILETRQNEEMFFMKNVDETPSTTVEWTTVELANDRGPDDAGVVVN